MVIPRVLTETAEPQRSNQWPHLRKAAVFLLAVGRSRSREREDTCSGRQQRRWIAERQEGGNVKTWTRYLQQEVHRPSAGLQQQLLEPDAQNLSVQNVSHRVAHTQLAAHRTQTRLPAETH